jgi:hypothetical protein
LQNLGLGEANIASDTIALLYLLRGPGGPRVVKRS